MRNTLTCLIIVLSLLACSTVMHTGRRQVTLVSESTLTSMAVQNYGEFLEANLLSTNSEYQRMVNEVGQNIKVAVEEYLTIQGMADDISSYHWEFNVVESDDINAWAMPGGKIVFYTGIMPICQDETGVAVVMGHEISHVLAKHGNERMSQQMIAQYGSLALNEFLKTKPAQTQQLYNLAYAVGAQYGAMLPYSRLHETEADEIGQVIMAMAGYDPGAAVDFWQRMATLTEGQETMEIMSTHPSNDSRIEALTKNTPKAREYLKK